MKVGIMNQLTEFKASGRPALIRIHGSSTNHEEALNIEQDQLSGTVSVDLSSFETGMKFRDQHLYQEIFNLTRFPKSTITLNGLKLNDSNFNGILDLHGVSKEIIGKQEFKPNTDQNWTYRIEFTVKMSDFGITPPSLLGMKVNDQVQVTVSGKMH